jgi:hypothetical protein
VPIFWQNPDGTPDGDQAGLVEFNTWLLSSPTWIQMVGEYTDSAGDHVGAGTVTAPVVVGPAPATIGLTELDNLVDTGTTTGNWPKADLNTIYVFYINQATSFVDGGCTALLGEHNVSSHGYYFALVLRCPGDPLPSLSDASVTATHEIGEASTDPNPPTGWVFAPFNIFNEGEDGDLCSDLTAAIPDGTHVVQRMFSNKANDAGHDPCVPAPAGETYANVQINPSAITVSASAGPTQITLQPFTDGTVTGKLNISFSTSGVNIVGPTYINPTDTNVTYQVSAAGASGDVPITVYTTQANGNYAEAYAAAGVTP